MINTQGNAIGTMDATTTDSELPAFNAAEVSSQVGNGRVFTGWASVPGSNDGRRFLAFRVDESGDINNKTYDLSVSNGGASASWWEGTSGGGQAPFLTKRGSLTITVDASTDTGQARFEFSAESPKGKTVDVKGQFSITLDVKGRA